MIDNCPNCQHPINKHHPRTSKTSFAGGKGEKPRYGCRWNKCICGWSPTEIMKKLGK